MKKIKALSLFILFLFISIQNHCSDDEKPSCVPAKSNIVTSTVQRVKEALEHPVTQQTLALAAEATCYAAKKTRSAAWWALQEGYKAATQRTIQSPPSPIQSRARSTSNASSEPDSTPVEDKDYEDGAEMLTFFPTKDALNENLKQKPVDTYDRLHKLLEQYFQNNNAQKTLIQRKLQETLTIFKEGGMILVSEIAKGHADAQIQELKTFTRSQIQKQQNIEMLYDEEHKAASEKLNATIDNAIEEYLQTKKLLDAWRLKKLTAGYTKGLLRAKNSIMLNEYARIEDPEDAYAQQIQRCSNAQEFQLFIITLKQEIQDIITMHQKRTQEAQALIDAVKRVAEPQQPVLGNGKKGSKKNI